MDESSLTLHFGMSIDNAMKYEFSITFPLFLNTGCCFKQFRIQNRVEHYSLFPFHRLGLMLHDLAI